MSYDADLKIFSLTDLNTPIDLGCSTSIQLPIEYNQYSSEYTVQLDNGTYVSGTFVTTGGESQSSKVNIEIDKSELKTLQTFLFTEDEFYIQAKYVDLWLYSTDWNGTDEPLNAIFKVRKKGFSINSRKGPNVYSVSLTIERLERL